MKNLVFSLLLLVSFVVPTVAAPVEHHLVAQRQKFAKELQSNSSLRRRLMYLIDKEVGSQGQRAQHMFVETVMNRAAALKSSIADVLDPDYYPPLRKGSGGVGKGKERHYGGLIQKTLGGSNLSNFATDNASSGLKNRRLRQGRPGVVASGELFYVDRPYTKYYNKMKRLSRKGA